MNENQSLYAVLVVLYLLDCVVWLRHPTVLFNAAWLGAARPAFGNRYLANNVGGLALLNPLPPLGQAWLGTWSPLSLAPQGVCAYTLQSIPGVPRQQQSGEVLAYAQIQSIAVREHVLELNGRSFVDCATPRQARAVAARLRALVACSEAGREPLLRAQLSSLFELAPAEQRLAQARRLSALLRIPCLVLFVWVFVFAPLLVMRLGLVIAFLPIVLGMLLVGLWVTWSFVRMHRVLFHSARRERRAHAWRIGMFPLAAIRAGDLLTLNALAASHPLLIARLLAGDGVTDFAAGVLRDLRHPLVHPLEGAEAMAICEWQRQTELAACEEFLRAEGLDVERLLAPEAPDGECLAYCPRCGSQYLHESGECPDCFGVALRRFTSTARSEPAA